jgi:MerR family transcriptional regulator, copper efflux regulator
VNGHVRVLSIGTLAKAVGITTPTIRYYETIGLLPLPARKPNGQRIYDDADVDRLTFIRRCRDFGFSIGQVRQLASLAISPDRNCAEVRDIADSHLTEVRVKLAELKALEQTLVGFVDQCDAACHGGPGHECLVFKKLSQPEEDERS